jgi:hypothetical protein
MPVEIIGSPMNKIIANPAGKKNQKKLLLGMINI